MGGPGIPVSEAVLRRRRVFRQQDVNRILEYAQAYATLTRKDLTHTLPGPGSLMTGSPFSVKPTQTIRCPLGARSWPQPGGTNRKSHRDALRNPIFQFRHIIQAGGVGPHPGE